MKARHKRGLLIAIALGLLGLATYLILNAFQQNLVFFYTPTQVANGEAPQNTHFRIGGLVLEDSIQHDKNGLGVNFQITDTSKQIAVRYDGILPDLFREGKGVVAQGQLNKQGILIANQVLAKHDENYMPPEAAAALEQAQKNRQGAP